jgi:hypothetical protein
MVARSLFVAAIIAALATITMAAPTNVTATAQVSASKTAQSSASGKVSVSNISTKTSEYSTQGLPASIFPTNSFAFSDTKPLNDGLETLSLQAAATASS